MNILDGGMGSELERRGVDTSLPLWSARALVTAPEIVERIHREYLEAGAEAITTNTFRTHRRSLAKAGWRDRSKELTERAVEIAQQARDAVNPRALVLGSVSPLEDCYEPALAPGREECAREHDEMVAALKCAGVDCILIETMNNLIEARCAIDAGRRHMPGNWIASFCMKPGSEASGAGVLLSGESIDPLARDLGEAHAVGVNCGAAPEMEGQVRHLRTMLPERVRVIAYANVGLADPATGWVNTDAVSPERYVEYAARWIDAGASIVGGCCGTTPATIAALAELIGKCMPDGQ